MGSFARQQYERAMKPDGREGNLPRWAQNRIAGLEKLAKGQQLDLEETLLATRPDESRVVLNPYDNTIGLGDRAMIRFKVEAESSFRGGLDCRLTSDGQWLQIQGDGRLTIQADATNTVRIKAVDR